MAEKKYDLLVQPKKNGNRNGKNSWYNEQIKTKHLKQIRTGEKPKIYDTRNWLFMKRGMDDFRNGFPPIGSNNTKVTTKVSPNLQKDFVRISELKNPSTNKQLARYKTYLTRETPHKQQQNEYISSVEQGLLEHPLALYSHLEKSVAPEVFEKILELLDPQFSQIDNDVDQDSLGTFDDDVDNVPWNVALSATQINEGKGKADQQLGFETSYRNMFRWLPQKENAKDSKKNKDVEPNWPSIQAEEEHIRKVTRDFCEWVADLGGETNNIEESTVTSLFASGYDTKPALSVPIHVVDLASVPHELRLSAMVPPPPPLEKQVLLQEKEDKKTTESSEPTFVKFRYGAWYLHPHTWKKMDYNEPLEDPKQLKKHEMSDAKKKCIELTEELSTMHASKAFDDFISKRYTRKPEFLVEIAEIQKRAELEEQKRQENEQLTKQKKAPSKKQSDSNNN